MPDRSNHPTATIIAPSTLAPPGDGGGHERERDDGGGPVDRSVEHEATPEVDRVGESIRSGAADR